MKHILVATVGVLALSLAGCNKSEQAAQGAANTAGEAADSAGAMASNAMVDVKQAMSPTPNGMDFANTAAKSDAFEIATSKLAQANATSKEVKDFAAEMIKAHTDSTSKI
ncbi:MAG: DUF4142 domain-containing protein, partial [Sphingomonas sp.]|nr:DUF4142 domain-containing protein [Sphingomonas sp.]